MKLTIKKLLLNINESSAKSKIAFFNVNGISALVENKNDTNKVNGTLNTLTLNDETTIYNNLYIERLIAHGEKPIEFEFIKNSGPPELVRNKDFEVAFKLKMDSARYIHIQRFIVTLVNYFQQFFSNMDALGRMKAIAEGIHNISFSPQRGARIKLDISIEKPIIVLPINNKSYNSYILTFDSIELGNKFQMAHEEKSSSNLAKIEDEKVETDVESNEERDCFLDCISVGFVGSLIYSAYYYKDYSEYKGEKGKNIEVNFGSGYFIQHSHQILKQPHGFILNLERNLENELSHKSPDWNIFTKLISVNFHLNWEQYNIIRGILDQNIGEPINQIAPLTFMVPNTKIETILTGTIWKVIRINLDLQNVGLEFIKLMDSIAFFNFENSSLTFESFSNGSKLIDLVSNVVQAYEQDFKKPNNEIKQKVNKSKTHLHNKKLYLSKKLNSDSKRLQVELHFRINKDSNRYSILLNNCFTIIQINWIAKIKEFLGSYNENNLIFKDFKTPSPFGPINQPIVKKMEIKLNLTNTDFALIEGIQNSSSQAIILRITAFLEFNEKKLLKPFQSCIQSIQFFSCQINLIDESALSILDPAMLNINLISKVNSSNSEFDSSAALNSLRNKTNIEFLLEISTDSLQFKLSYLDLRLILTIIENLKLQIGTNQDSASQRIEDKDKLNSKSEVWIINNINLTINNFSMLVIDDCKDIDIPFIEIQLNRLRINQIFSEESNPHDKKMLNFNLGQGSAEFALNISFYNRYLSGWEPLIEPWLSRFDWKMKHDKRCFTVTSMDVLNLNVTNPLLDLIKTVISNWKDDFDNKSFNKSKFNKIFQPYKLINLTGQTIKFQIFENDSGSKLKTFEHDDLTRLDNNETEWVSIEDKCEKSFNFYEKKHYLFSQKHRRTASTAEELDNKRYFNLHYLNRTNKRSNQLIQNQIRIKLDSWSEIRPLTIDKVGTYYRNLSRVNQATSTDISYSLPNDTRLIFNISLSDNATKSIEIKSPVSIKNNLNFKVQCRIEPRIEYIMNRIGPLITEIQVGDEMSIPIKYLPCNLWFRPIEFDANTEVEFSTFPINLNEVNQPDQIEYYQINCKLSNIADTLLKPISIKENEDIFYFFAKIKCHNFTKRLASTKEDLEKHQDYYSSLFNVEKKLPGHSIFLESPFTLYNFLPLEFRYKFISHANSNSKLEQIINGKIDSYNQKNFHNIDVSKQIDLLLDIDNFRIARSIEINPSKHLANFFRNQSNKEASSDSSDTENKNEIKNTKSNFLPMLSNRKLTVLRRVNFHDAKNRPLFLIAKIVFKIGSGLNIKRKNSNLEDVVNFNPCPITIQISSIYCFFNLTGLPLIFRQYNCDEASGQLEEHEMACNNQPLLFSFNEIDSPYACSMRIGKQFKDFYQHTLNRASGDNKLSEIVPKWCKPFGLDSGSSFRSLIVTNDSDSKQNQDFQIENIPNKNWVYYVGIEIKPGKGLLKDTTFVYFSTRYYLVNKSNKNLMIAQNLFIRKLKEKHIDYSSTSKKTLSTIAYNEYEAKHSIVLLNDSMVQFNWPLADYDQTLSVRLKEEPNYNWSGAFKIGILIFLLFYVFETN
jgi:vacuolar protein sorting-associated protein 13D